LIAGWVTPAMKLFLSASVGSAALLLLLLVGCSTAASEEEAPPKDEVGKLEQRLEGQGVALMPFALGDVRCSLDADPTMMNRDTLASCAHLDLAKLPADLVVTDDPRVFDPRSDSDQKRTILVFVGPTIESSESRGWIAAVGLGPTASATNNNTQLVKSTTTIRPQVAMAAPLLIEGGKMLIAAGIAFFGAKAIVATGEAVLNQSQSRPIVEESERVVTRQSRLINCTPDEHELLKSNKTRACDVPDTCERAAARIGGGGSLCLGLDSRRKEFQKCRDARQEVTDRCFGGKPDEEHARQIANMDRLVKECDSLLSQRCP
jgi:hypothetical protein